MVLSNPTLLVLHTEHANSCFAQYLIFGIVAIEKILKFEMTEYRSSLQQARKFW